MSWDIPIGTEFAGYRITSVLGRGGMSVVYTAEHVGLGRTVALKLLSASLAADQSFRERFTRESRLAATLDHANIVPIYDAGEADGFLYIAMRHVEGYDLGTLLEQEGPLPLGQTLFYMEQVAGALDQAHEQGLIHRDVKPANILIARPSDRVFLTDFGVVKQASSQGLTKTGYFLGTFEYAAPEQIEGRAVDARTDIYALGCVLYECLSGEPPFKAETEGSVIHAHLTEPPPRLTAKRPDLPIAINDVIATAMAKAMEDRYSSCGEFIRALRAVALGTVSGERRPSPAAATVQAPADSGFSPKTEAVPSPSEVVSPQPEAAAPPTEALPPPAEPAAPRPSTPPAPPKTPRTLTLSGGRLLAAAAALAAIIAGAVVAAVLLSGGGGKKAGSPGTNPTTTATAPAAIGLAGVVPNDLFKYCTTVSPRAGAGETASCRPTGTTGTTFLPNSWEISLYPSATALHDAYNGLRRANGIGQDYGHCSGIAWGGEGGWAHGPGKPGGRRFCYFDGNFAVIVWTHERLGQASHVDTLGMARASGSDHYNLFSWYRFWHHRIGKCPAPDCVARLK
ncbi:MAG: serine/threonine-protein kinase [Gaiellaceae bacterium]